MAYMAYIRILYGIYQPWINHHKPSFPIALPLLYHYYTIIIPLLYHYYTIIIPLFYHYPQVLLYLQTIPSTRECQRTIALAPKKVCRQVASVPGRCLLRPPGMTAVVKYLVWTLNSFFASTWFSIPGFQ